VPRMPRLDLTAVVSQDAQPTEVGARRHKMAAYEKQCSQILEGLYISGEFVAKDLHTLQMNGITHVINCVGALYEEYFKDKMKYKTLYLRGASAASLSWSPAVARLHFAMPEVVPCHFLHC
jgi:hypothetical protein